MNINAIRVWTLGLAVALAVVYACQEPPAARSAPVAAQTASGLDLETVKLVDLSYPYDESTLYWPTSPSHFELEELANGVSDGGYYYSAYVLGTPEHGGTHIDAPIHFAENAATTAEIPLGQLIGPGIVIDVSEQAAAERDYRLDLATVKQWEETNGPVPRGAIVILRTGWGARWPDAMAYLGDDRPGDASNLHFPGYGEAATRYLVDERGVGGLGIDTASIDYGQSNTYGSHVTLMTHNIPALENVANIEQVPTQGAHLFAMPIKIKGGSGGPTRIAAFLPD